VNPLEAAKLVRGRFNRYGCRPITKLIEYFVFIFIVFDLSVAEWDGHRLSNPQKSKIIFYH
jgi:hypothetical protein